MVQGNMLRTIVVLQIACCSLLCGTVSAQEEQALQFISVQLENDSFNNDSDGYYTHGIEVSQLRMAPPPAWLETAAGWLPFHDDHGKPHMVNYSLGQKIFTPRDKQAASLVADDRPYAGYLYVSAAVPSLTTHTESYDYGNLFELTLGIVGPSAMGEKTQNTVHDMLGNGGHAQGWDYQLHDELALGISYTHLWRIVRPAPGGLEYGLNPHLTLAVGNVQTYGAGGIVFRLGDDLRRDLNPPNIRPGFPGVPYFASEQGMDWYGFVGYEVRWVARDIFLDGNSTGESHSVNKELLVGDLQYGMVFLHRDIRLSISQTRRTREFTTQQGDSGYMAINVSLRY
jgi:lipid A 3-O-deacylase